MATTVIKRKKSTYVGHNHLFNQMMRERRKEKGWSCQSLADKIGSGSKSYIMDIEKGKYAVSVELGLAICQVLEIPPHLCIDYISVLEIERIKRNIRQQYAEWVDYVPGDVFYKMLSDQESVAMHKLLLEG